jgi:hypothetical protein
LHAGGSRYHRLPDALFKNNTSECRNLPNLIAYFAPLSPCATASLNSVHAFYHAFSKTFPATYGPPGAHYLKRYVDANKSRIEVPRQVIHDFQKQTTIQINPEQFSVINQDHVVLPRRVRDVMLRILNDNDAIKTTLEESCTIRSNLLGRPASLKHWERFRLLSPKASGALVRLRRNDDSMALTPQEVSDETLNGRSFWFQVPPVLDMRSL